MEKLFDVLMEIWRKRMSREIKFKAWIKEEKTMINVARIDIADGACYSRLFAERCYDSNKYP